MFALVSAAWWQGLTFLQVGRDLPEHLQKPGEHQPAQCFFIAAEKAGPNLFKACLQCGCKLALVCGRLKPALHLMQLHSLFPAVCCLSSSCQESERILNNGCCRTWCLPQSDRQCRMSWTELAVLLQNEVGLCKALLQEASTQSKRGQVRRALVFSHEDFEQSAIGKVTRQVIQHIPKCAFKRYINKFSRLQKIFAAGVAKTNSQNSTHHDVLESNPFATTKLR
jgi:hypothetical protein